MRARQGSVLETLRRVQKFLDTSREVLKPLEQSGARRALDQSIAQLSAHAVDQAAGLVGSKGETARQRAFRVALRTAHMRPIATIARSQLRSVPEFASLQLPDARRTSITQVTAARAMARAATPHAETFVAAGLPTDFVERLLAAADAVETSMLGRNQNRGQRVGATKGLKDEEKRGRQTVKVLDSLVLPALGTTDYLIAEWNSLKKVAAKPGVPARAATQVPPTVPAATLPGATEPAATVPPATSHVA
jgi:hypothetical protein